MRKLWRVIWYWLTASDLPEVKIDWEKEYRDAIRRCNENVNRQLFEEGFTK